jgi:hypothetical protein
MVVIITIILIHHLIAAATTNAFIAEPIGTVPSGMSIDSTVTTKAGSDIRTDLFRMNPSVLKS